MAQIGIIMGSDSDMPVMKEAVEILKSFDIDIEVDIVSAHRTPEKLMEYGSTAHQRGLKVIIAGAGGAAHLPGMIAAISPLPVIGVPVKSSNSIDGWDSVLSILQMPGGVPVATVALHTPLARTMTSDLSGSHSAEHKTYCSLTSAKYRFLGTSLQIHAIWRLPRRPRAARCLAMAAPVLPGSMHHCT